MKYLRKFNEGMSEQLVNSDDAREVLSTVYNIVDEIDFRSFNDFLVDIDQFIGYVDKYNGYFAGNRFNTIEEFKSELDDVIEGFNYLISDTPIMYVSPFWFSRRPEDITGFESFAVYSATIYLKVDNNIIEEMRNDRDFNSKIKDDIDKLKIRLDIDEVGIHKSVNGNYYLRLWWD